MPLDAAAQYSAARESVAVYDLSDRTQLEMTGPDRHSFLHNFTTNNINALPSGCGCEAFLCNVKGRLLGHVFIFTDEESTWLDGVPGQNEFLTSHLEKYHLLEDFKLTDRTAERGELLVIGPETNSALTAVGVNVDGLSLMQCRHDSESSLDVRQIGLFGDLPYLVSGPGDVIEALRQRLIESGVTPGERAVFETLRVESGFPAYGIDLSEANLAQEASRTQEAISFEKGCYLGQEPIARIHAMGHVNRQLCRFAIDSEHLPAAGTALLNPADESKEIGTVTSVAWSWKLERPIGLGMVRTKWAKLNAEVMLATEPRAMACVISGE